MYLPTLISRESGSAKNVSADPPKDIKHQAIIFIVVALVVSGVLVSILCSILIWGYWSRSWWPRRDRDYNSAAWQSYSVAAAAAEPEKAPEPEMQMAPNMRMAPNHPNEAHVGSNGVTRNGGATIRDV